MEIISHDSLATIPELAAQTKLPRSWFYERSRVENLPGLRRLGKYVRIDRDEFFAALKAGKIR